MKISIEDRVKNLVMLGVIKDTDVHLVRKMIDNILKDDAEAQLEEIAEAMQSMDNRNPWMTRSLPTGD